MTRLTRRQFLGTTAAGALAAPYIWVRPSWAQSKQLSILCWSHFVPAYDKWFDQWGQEWAGKNNIKLTIDHAPHLSIPPKIAAEVATQSGHDIVQMVGTGSEKFAPALIDVQDLADKLGKKYGGGTPPPPNLSPREGPLRTHPPHLIHFPRPPPPRPLNQSGLGRPPLPP